MDRDNACVMFVLIFVIGLSSTITNCGIRMTVKDAVAELKQPCTEQIK